MSRGVTPTRNNLKKLRERIELAERSLDLLEKKRDGLIMEFMDVLAETETRREDLEGAYQRAQHRASLVRATEGGVALTGIARTRRSHPTVTVTQRNVMGVVVPEIESTPFETPLEERGYGLLGTSPTIDEVAHAYESLLTMLVEVAQLETTLERFITEIERTIKRANALEKAVLPKMRAELKRIQRHLDEKEREEIIRRKWIKRKKQDSRRRKPATAAEDDSDESEPETPPREVAVTTTADRS